MIDLTKISPTKAYTVAETAELIGIHQDTLRRKISKKNDDPFIYVTKPVNTGKGWIFNGSRILDALGTPSQSLMSEVTSEKNNYGQ